MSRLSVLSSVHPWLRDRLVAIETFLSPYGGTAEWFSGNRSNADQQYLWELRNQQTRVAQEKGYNLGLPPVARPGCSQHNYQSAVDVRFSGPGGDRRYNDYARALFGFLGGSVLPNDATHYQIYSPTTWRGFLDRSPSCPSIDSSISARFDTAVVPPFQGPERGWGRWDWDDF